MKIDITKTFQNLKNLKFLKTKENTWTAKAVRTANCVFPVSSKRTGKCVSCGKCCELPIPCPFLAYNKENKSYCLIYDFRPLNCRKYPRNEDEFITKDSCGYKFE